MTTYHGFSRIVFTPAASVPAPPADRVPIIRDALCEYCRRYRRACGRHEERRVEPARKPVEPSYQLGDLIAGPDVTMWTMAAGSVVDVAIHSTYSDGSPREYRYTVADRETGRNKILVPGHELPLIDEL